MDQHRHVDPDDPLYNEIKALTSAVRIMRRMRGKSNLEDSPFRSPEWDIICAEFVFEVYKVMDDDPGDLRPIDL